MEDNFIDFFDNSIKLLPHRWKHIVRQHPEVKSHKNKIHEVLRTPDLVKRSKRDKDTFLYYRYYNEVYKGKYLLVVARTKNEPMILTCYITDKIKKGDMIWEKN